MFHVEQIVRRRVEGKGPRAEKREHECLEEIRKPQEGAKSTKLKRR
jgi:hypothetical protein